MSTQAPHTIGSSIPSVSELKIWVKSNMSFKDLKLNNHFIDIPII